MNGPPPQPTLPAVRHAILELIARLALGKPTKAGEQLARLEGYLPDPLHRTDDLKRAIAAYNTLAVR